MLVLMLWQWSGPEWGTWGTAAWSPRRLWMWRRCSSLRWSTFPNKHTPSTTRHPACVPLCPLGKSISSWATRMRRRPGRSSGMWERMEGFFFYWYQSLLLETELFLVLGCFWLTAPLLRSGRTKWTERLRWAPNIARLHVRMHMNVHPSKGSAEYWHSRFFLTTKIQSHVCVWKHSWTTRWSFMLSPVLCLCPEVGSDSPEKRPNIFTAESSLRSDTETCVHVGVHVDIAL